MNKLTSSIAVSTILIYLLVPFSSNASMSDDILRLEEKVSHLDNLINNWIPEFTEWLFVFVAAIVLPVIVVQLWRISQLRKEMKLDVKNEVASVVKREINPALDKVKSESLDEVQKQAEVLRKESMSVEHEIIRDLYSKQGQIYDTMSEISKTSLVPKSIGWKAGAAQSYYDAFDYTSCQNRLADISIALGIYRIPFIEEDLDFIESHIRYISEKEKGSTPIAVKTKTIIKKISERRNFLTEIAIHSFKPNDKK